MGFGCSVSMVHLPILAAPQIWFSAVFWLLCIDGSLSDHGYPAQFPQIGNFT